MLDFLSAIVDSETLSPHGFCLLWRPELIWLHVVSDALIGLSYFSIPVALAMFVWKRRDVAFGWVLWLFVVFITACGTTHFATIWTLFRPDYGIEGLIKLATAMASVVTAVMLWPLLPRALALPSPAALRLANAQLLEEVAERNLAVAALRRETAERERAEAMLRQAQKMEAVGQLTGGIAHDFNNLMTVVAGNLELLRRRLKAEAPEIRRTVDNAMVGVERAAKLTSQLLSFARKQPLRPQVVDMNRLVAGMDMLLVRALGEKVRLETRLAPELPPVEADPNQLESALLNLAVNARDAMPEGGTLTVATECPAEPPPDLPPEMAPGRYVVVSVADTGAGMTPEVLERAVEPFFTTKEVGRGSGLGLSQVYGFAQQSRGHLAIESAPGRGTTVRLYLPVAAGPAP
ncbi:MAG TPA: ATP-binding protein [Alphaproteobacteria bacterium]|nr:ATP-binding protein [Alphaproteobacteria bacterium]